MIKDKITLEDLQNKDFEDSYNALLSYLNSIRIGNARESASDKVWVELDGVLDVDGLPFEILMNIEDYNNIKKIV
jgi:hypothetical protein